MDEMILGTITINNTIDAEASTVQLHISDGVSWYDAHAMLSIALATLDHYFANDDEDD